MIKQIFFIFMMSLSLVACASVTYPNTEDEDEVAASIAIDILKYTADQKCRSELQNYSAWKAVSMAMTPAQQKTALNNICGCTSEKIPRHVTMEELAQAATDPSVHVTINQAIAHTVNECYKEMMKK